MVISVAFSEGPLISYQSFLLGLVGSILIMSFASGAAKKIHLVDVNDEPRKDHEGRIPLVGGIGLFISLIYGTLVFGVNTFYLYVLASLLPIMLMGILDGIQGIIIKPAYRLIAQILSSWLVIIFSDIYIRDLGNLFGLGNLYIGELGIPFTIFCVVGITNAFNMIDGKDGLLGSVSFVIMFSLMSLIYINGTSYFWPLIVSLSILVYLAFNLSLFGNKRKIFLGDHGSTSLGHIVAWTLIYLSQEIDLITPASALWFVLLPLTDAFLTFTRRLRSSHSVFEADRRHFHHLLSNNGYSNITIVVICSVITVLGCFLSILFNLFMIPESLTFYGYMTLLVILILLGFAKPITNYKD